MWEDELPDPVADDEPKPVRLDLAGTLISANGFMILAFGVLLMLTPVGNGQSVDAPDFGPVESAGMAALGVALLVASVWRRDRRVVGVAVSAAGLLGAVACLAVVGAALLAVIPTLGILALVNSPYPAVEER